MIQHARRFYMLLEYSNNGGMIVFFRFEVNSNLSH